MRDHVPRTYSGLDLPPVRKVLIKEEASRRVGMGIAGQHCACEQRKPSEPKHDNRPLVKKASEDEDMAQDEQGDSL